MASITGLLSTFVSSNSGNAYPSGEYYCGDASTAISMTKVPNWDDLLLP